MLIIANEGAEQGLVRRAIVRKPEKTAHLVGQLADTLGARLPVAARERAVDEVDLCQREPFGLWEDGLVVVVQMAELVECDVDLLVVFLLDDECSSRQVADPLIVLSQGNTQYADVRGVHVDEQKQPSEQVSRHGGPVSVFHDHAHAQEAFAGRLPVVERLPKEGVTERGKVKDGEDQEGAKRILLAPSHLHVGDPEPKHGRAVNE